MYNKTKKGPSTEPWGTPALVDLNIEAYPSSTNFCFLFNKKFFTQLVTRFEILYCLDFTMIPACQTPSKALEKS